MPEDPTSPVRTFSGIRNCKLADRQEHCPHCNNSVPTYRTPPLSIAGLTPYVTLFCWECERVIGGYPAPMPDKDAPRPSPRTQELTDDSIMPMGRYSQRDGNPLKMKDVPREYLFKMLEAPFIDQWPALKKYIEGLR